MSNKMAHVIYSIDGNVKNKKFTCDNVKLNAPFFEFYHSGELVKVIPVNSIKDLDFIEETKAAGGVESGADKYKILAENIWEALNKVDYDPMHPQLAHFDDQVKSEIEEFAKYMLEGFNRPDVGFNSLVLPVMEYMRKNHSEDCKLAITGYNAEITAEQSLLFLGFDLAKNEVVFDVSDTFMIVDSEEAFDEYTKAATDNNFKDNIVFEPEIGSVVWCNKMTIMTANKEYLPKMVSDGLKEVIFVDGKLAYKSEQ